MPDADPQRVAELLAAAQRGERRATDDLVALLYDELKRVATSLLRGAGGAGPVTLQSTALVNEAYLRLAGGKKSAWESRAHFFGAAARAMRQILIDRARSARVGRRSDSAVESIAVSLGGDAPSLDDDMIALDTAMSSLEARDQRQHDVVMLRFFAGLTVEQTADVLDVSPATVKNDWSYARAWLMREMERARGTRP